MVLTSTITYSLVAYINILKRSLTIERFRAKLEAQLFPHSMANCLSRIYNNETKFMDKDHHITFYFEKNEADYKIPPNETIL